MNMTMLLLLDDSALLYGFQAFLVVLTCYAELKDRGWFRKLTGANATVLRGDTSWNALNICFGIITVNVLQIINSADDSVRFKVLMSAFDLGLLIRLFFFNGWFRNRTIGLVGKARNMEEGLRTVPVPSVLQPAKGVNV
jgi:hypothetical protein